MPPNKASPGHAGTPSALICLPPVSEDLLVVWTEASQTSDLDAHQPLLQAFSRFPYPSLADMALLCLRHSLKMEKVKAWFMAQRLRCGISWSPEEIEATRVRLAVHWDQMPFRALLASRDPLAQAGKSQGASVPAPSKAQESWVTSVVQTPGAASMVSPYQAHEIQVTSPVQAPGAASIISPYQAQEIQVVSSVPTPTGSRHRAPESKPPTGPSLQPRVEAPAVPPPSLYPTPPPAYRAWMDFPAASSLDLPPQGVGTAPWDLSKPSRLGAPDGGGQSEAVPTSSSLASSRGPAVPPANGAKLWGQHPSPEAQQQPRKIKRKTKEQLAMLKSFFLRCQWAQREDYLWLEQVTGLPRTEIIQWFGDTRYALKHGQLKWFWDNTMPGSGPPAQGSGPTAQGAEPPAQATRPLSQSPKLQPDTAPLESYWAAHWQLREVDVPALCQQSGMGREEVLNWFYSRSPEPAEVEVCLGEEDGGEEEEEVMAPDEEEEEEEEEEEDEEDDDDDEDDLVLQE
ncbi:homeobox and leucine zipper protein Homez [Alligator sinensis]|uniref:Homeobox and Leucine zipper protein Homez n=1 Tax=Alligator sinensis TaxID=38654 RepID=A0A1U7S875_ALLSI|nr:homeobox and leucine zipper protein Homez [Alligator sinensis]XP_025048570.1 homeobox and leucine zipper protein Homez [Alligator sinensis]XP_025048571.1 homeobox and leucine zipper protein Homez [Alligator sinensis]XP_025048572.1 homeobox and leucine zipper protein Homez [Alligator sinensis]XP_025048573.1 homeobox and leucine zipper protein Homez [Alligator sinensis]